MKLFDDNLQITFLNSEDEEKSKFMPNYVKEHNLNEQFRAKN